MKLRYAMWATTAVLFACGGEQQGNGTPAAEAAPLATEQAQDVGQLACEPQRDPAGRASPYDSTRFAIDGGEVLICYGRPSARGRTMLGGEQVPYGRLWRTGANEPTIMHLSAPATVAGIDVEPGSYSLYTIPGESEWTVIVNRAIDQWGHESSYTPEVEAQEVGRGTVTAERFEDHIEQFTIRADDADAGTLLILEWEHTRVPIPVRAR